MRAFDAPAWPHRPMKTHSTRRYEHVGVRSWRRARRGDGSPLGGRSRASYRPGGNPKVSPKVNRRELLAGGSVLSAAAAITALAPQAHSGVELGRYTRRDGVHGKMTGAAGRGRGPLVPGSPLRLRHSGRPEQRALGRPQSQRHAVSTGGSRGFRQRDGRRRRPGHRNGRGFRRRARTGFDQRPDRDRRGSVRQHPDRRYCQRHRSLTPAQDRPGPRAGECRNPPAGRQNDCSKSAIKPRYPKRSFRRFRSPSPVSRGP